MTGRILIIDHHAGRRALLRDMIAALYCEVEDLPADPGLRTAASARRADLVFIEVSEADEPLNRRFEQSEAAIIATLPQDAAAQDALRAFQAGADAVIRRPYSASRLQAVIRSHMQERRLRQILLRPHRAIGLTPGIGFGEPATLLQTPARPLLRFAPDGGEMVPPSWLSELPAITGRAVAEVDAVETVLFSCEVRSPAAVLVGPFAPGNGIEALTLIGRMRANPDFSDLPLILIGEDDALAARAFELGINDLFEPGIDAREADARITALERRRARTERLRIELDQGVEAGYRDQMTALGNRRDAEMRGPQILAEAMMVGRPCAILMIDVDRFKRVNDRYGHDAGDDVLRAIAERLQAVLRSGDLLARLGGEEFLAVLPGLDEQTVLPVAERLRRTIADTPIAITGPRAIRVTVSIGVAIGRADRPAEFATLRRHADKALYASKHGGRNQVHLADLSEGPAAAHMNGRP